MKLALVAIAAAAFVALPQMSSINANGEAKAPGALLFTVTTTDDHNDSSCDPGDCTLREAIEAANNNAGADEIAFSVTGTINLAGSLPAISDDLEITGPGANLLTVRRSSGPHFRIVTVTTTGTATISGLTITRGAPDGSGAGLLNLSTGTVNVINCALVDNLVDDGSGRGGAIYNSGAGTVNVTNSEIFDNQADFGGGIYNSLGTVNITNTTVDHNSSSKGGAGIYNSGGTVNVSNSTLTANSSIRAPGGIGNLGNFSGTINIKSSIIALNTAVRGSDEDTAVHPDVEGAFASQGFNLIGKRDGSTGFTAATDLTGTIASPLDPMLDPNGLQDNGGPTKTIALLCGSPAIDQGTSKGLTGALTTDQRGTGFPRTVDDPLVPNANDTQGDGTDIGAFELNTQNCNHPPVAQCKNIQVSAGANCQASITASQVDNGSFDPDPGDSIATRTLDNSGPFGLGPHTVMLTVTDTHGASSSCSAMVTVVDTTSPTVTCPANPSVPAEPGQCQAVVTYANATVSDNCPGAMLLGCAPQSGSIFQVGTTPVTCTAKDVAGNNGSCQFQVIVFDNQPPTITCPANITALTDQSACPNPACKVVSYPPPVVMDTCPGTITVCNPPSGSCFPTGTTNVTCTATDASGNTATCSFTVTTFDVALQDDSNPSIILLWNSITGEYRFCCNGTTFTGFGVSIVKGCTYTLQHNPADRRVLGKVDKSVHAGSGSLQSPPGQIRCTITDRSTLNDTNLTSCQ